LLGGKAPNLGDLLKPGASLDANLLISMAVFFATISAAIKLIFALLSAYVRFFINTIIAPLTLLMGALPGNNNNVSKWIKGYVASALSFVAVYVVMNIAYYIMLMGVAGSPGNVEINKIVAPSALSGIPSSTTYQLIVFAIVLLLPAIPAAIDEALETSPGRALSGTAGDASQALKKIPIVGGFLG
jgi:hypothetical protein